MGFRVPVLKLLESYLGNGYQHINTNSFKTYPWPPLFILYTTALQIATKKTGVLLYADETIDYIALAHQSTLLEVNDWLEKNKLTLNIKRTKTMSHCRTKKTEKRPVK